MTERKTRSRLTGGIIAVIVLAVCLVVTTVALAYSIASVRDNTFATGGQPPSGRHRQALCRLQ